MPSSSDKYEADDPDFDEEHGVLCNKLGILDEAELEHVENEALIEAYDHAALEYTETHRFAEQDVCLLHKLFLGSIYEWAGTYRRVDISSQDIRWCHAKFIPKQMAEFGHLLENLTPFSPDLSREEVFQRLAKIHAELIVIHPFRDGNGRVTRLLCNLLLMQSGRAPIQLGNFDDQLVRLEYFAAVRAAWERVDYIPLIVLFEKLAP